MAQLTGLHVEKESQVPTCDGEIQAVRRKVEVSKARRKILDLYRCLRLINRLGYGDDNIAGDNVVGFVGLINTAQTSAWRMR